MWDQLEGALVGPPPGGPPGGAAGDSPRRGGGAELHVYRPHPPAGGRRGPVTRASLAQPSAPRRGQGFPRHPRPLVAPPPLCPGAFLRVTHPFKAGDKLCVWLMAGKILKMPYFFFVGTPFWVSRDPLPPGREVPPTLSGRVPAGHTRLRGSKEACSEPKRPLYYLDQTPSLLQPSPPNHQLPREFPEGSMAAHHPSRSGFFLLPAAGQQWLS